MTCVSVTSDAAIIGSHTANQDGSFTYVYTVDNTSGFFDIVAWSLEFPILPDWNPDDMSNQPPGDVAVATDWIAQSGTPVTGMAAQDFISIDMMSEVLVGSSQAGFSFTSDISPGEIVYFEFGGSGETEQGVTVGPIPEPSTWVIFGAVLAVLAGLRRAAQNVPERLQNG